MNQRQLLVTSALPYANGHLHLGHLVEHIQTDVWVRFQKMRGHQVVAVCGDDAHGSPIMLKAESLGITPEELVTQMKASHEEDFQAFRIEYDCYHTTHSEENRKLAELVYSRLKENGDISQKIVKQAFDPEKQMFLPDRYVKGECPKCGAADQYGDSCEACGATYSPLEMKNAKSVLTGATPVEKESTHLFFELSRYEATLNKWLASDKLQPEVSAKLKEWFEHGLKPWCISRDAPYFGFEIPGEDHKYFYVWLDAPIGYLASFKKYCETHEGVDFDKWLDHDGITELYHFIGKDIIYFHGLFWPAMLEGAKMRLPSAIYTHGFLTVNGQKMSKSRGTFIQAKTYLEHLNPEYLRYYFAAKLACHIDDIDLNFEDFVARINSDLVGKVVNIASRAANFISKRFDGKLADKFDDDRLVNQFVSENSAIAKLFEDREYAKAVRSIMHLADLANQYIADRAPWALIKDEKNLPEVHAICTTALELFRLLTLYLKPITPKLAEDAESFLNCGALKWGDVVKPLLGGRIEQFQPLMTRVDEEAIEKMLEASKENLASATTKGQTGEPLSEEIGIEDFSKIDLRIAKILEAEGVEGADKLLRLKVDIGGETRQIFAGIKAHKDPASLIGRHTVVVANLKPRKMRFGLSQGMMLCASGDDGLFLLEPESGAKPGMRVK